MLIFTFSSYICTMCKFILFSYQLQGSLNIVSHLCPSLHLILFSIFNSILFMPQISYYIFNLTYKSCTLLFRLLYCVKFSILILQYCFSIFFLLSFWTLAAYVLDFSLYPVCFLTLFSYVLCSVFSAALWIFIHV